MNDDPKLLDWIILLMLFIGVACTVIAPEPKDVQVQELTR